MFAHSTRRADATLPELLIERARSASDRRLALDVGGGIIAVVVLGWWRPAGWLLLASLSLGFVAFGAWGIADRELNERGSPPGALTALLRGVRVAAVLMGMAATVVVTMHALALLLGRWIS